MDRYRISLGYKPEKKEDVPQKKEDSIKKAEVSPDEVLANLFNRNYVVARPSHEPSLRVLVPSGAQIDIPRSALEFGEDPRERGRDIVSFRVSVPRLVRDRIMSEIFTPREQYQYGPPIAEEFLRHQDFLRHQQRQRAAWQEDS